MSCIIAFYLAACGGLIPAAYAQQSAPADPDALYRQRENLPDARRAAGIWSAQVDAGGSYEAAWKLARVDYWLGTRGDEAERRPALEGGVRAGELAARLQPDRPEGHFWLAADEGALAQGFGLLQGLKYRGRVKSELERVLAIDPAWLQGSADRALGVWYWKVPGLFGGSRSQAIAHLRRALAYNPQSTATLEYLGEVLLADGRRDEARAAFERCLAAPLDPDWAPEDREFKRLAAERLKSLTGGADGRIHPGRV